MGSAAGLCCQGSEFESYMGLKDFSASNNIVDVLNIAILFPYVFKAIVESASESLEHIFSSCAKISIFL